MLYVSFLGRLLLSLIFLFGGLSKLRTWKQTAGYMASKRMSWVPLFLIGAIVLEVGGGISVFLGWETRIGAAALVLFLIPAALIFHNFWANEGMERQIQMAMFLKNISIMGGLLLLVYFGPGPMSIDGH
ncbi:MAG: DoxX family protein [Candidatus Sulfotelmatobacter sp.]